MKPRFPLGEQAKKAARKSVAALRGCRPDEVEEATRKALEEFETERRDEPPMGYRRCSRCGGPVGVCGEGICPYGN